MIKHRNSVHVHYAGRVVVGRYSLDPNCRTLTVDTLAGHKPAHIGALSPLSLGRILLRELATEGLEGLTAL
jgi:ribosomal protein S14